MNGAAIVVVSYDTRELLAACLASLRRHAPGAPVVVVDNASADGSAAMVAERFPEARLLANPDNRGFAAAVNQGIRAAGAPRLLVLNADTELRPGALEALRAALDADERLAVAAPRLVHPDGRPQESRMRFPGILDSLRFPMRGGAPSRVEDPAALLAAKVRDGGPSWYPMGAALLFRRAALDAVGPLDERYFFYLEEVDWFRRAWGAGWSWALVPAAEIVHHLGASLRAAGPVVEARVKRNWHRSRMRYFRRHAGAGPALLYRLGALPWLALNALRHAARAGMGGGEEARLRAGTARAILVDCLLARTDRC